jgi:hypothetical protein
MTEYSEGQIRAIAESFGLPQPSKAKSEMPACNWNQWEHRILNFFLYPDGRTQEAVDDCIMSAGAKAITLPLP